MKYECNIFKNVWDRDCSNVCYITSVLKAIKAGRWKDQVLKVREAKAIGDKKSLKNLKFHLPAVTWSGVFEERCDDAIVKYNQLMVIDIDEISDKRLEKLKPELRNNPWVFSYFNGPSKGIKVLVFIDSPEEWHSTHAFKYLEDAFKELYGIKIDKSGKNTSRLCFVSYDEDLYINDKPERLHIKEYVGVDSFTSLSGFNYDNAVPIHDGKYIIEICIKMVKKCKVGHYRKGNRNNYIFVLSSLACEFGIDPMLAFTLIYGKYSSLGQAEIKNTIASAYKRNKKNFATRTVGKRSNSKQIDLL